MIRVIINNSYNLEKSLDKKLASTPVQSDIKLKELKCDNNLIIIVTTFPLPICDIFSAIIINYLAMKASFHIPTTNLIV